jgi:hypothetical protein
MIAADDDGDAIENDEDWTKLGKRRQSGTVQMADKCFAHAESPAKRRHAAKISSSTR